MKKLNIHILKHDKVGRVEQCIIRTATKRGHSVRIIDPRRVLYGKKMTKRETPDVILARPELSSLSEPIFAAYLTYLTEYQNKNVPILNGLHYIIMGQDKYLTHLQVEKYFRENNIKTDINPETCVAFDKNIAESKAMKMIQKDGSCVIKKPDSGRGEGVFHVTNERELRLLLHSFSNEEPIMIQKTIEKEKKLKNRYRDIRIIVSRDAKTGEPIVEKAYYRNAPQHSFLTNLSRGGSITKYDSIDTRLVQYAKCVLDAVQGDLAGIDFVRDVKGNYYFEEVNIAFEVSPQSEKIIGKKVWANVVDLIEARGNVS
ncbi:hypothetical protein IPM65_07625 [Candidatus Roizmanbacteria bacterium]|nr:MAG: hypothetical protein IPM65_07625 [Candidatus Roizmanbacteria bacterium]